MLRRLLRPIVEIRDEEAATLVLMFAYSFLAMTGYNILKPITRSKFITAIAPTICRMYCWLPASSSAC